MNLNYETYQPRNDFVLIRVIDRSQAGNIALPQQSAAGKELHVVAVGKKVEGLKAGDVVFAIGVKGQDLVFLPASTSYFLTRESNVVCIVPPE